LKRVLLNGLNSTTGGGKSILDNYLSLLEESDNNDTYFVLVSDAEEYQRFSNNHVEVVDIKWFFKISFLFPITYKYVLPRLIKSLRIDVIFNLADIPIPISGVRQVFLFDWPYAVYPESSVWKSMDLKSFVVRKVKLKFFSYYLKYITVMIAQTETIKNRLIRLYGARDIIVVPNAVTLEHSNTENYFNFSMPKGKLLLCLSHYYPHKNFEIFIPLAKAIKRLALDYKIIVTIEASHHQKAKEFLKQVKHFGLSDIIYNVGVVEMGDVPSLFQQCDALLMPTLLETYCLPYVEAMQNRRLIITSDMDFSRDVCGDAGIYFDPLDHRSILESIESIFSNGPLRELKLTKGEMRLRALNSWPTVVNKYINILGGSTIEDK